MPERLSTYSPDLLQTVETAKMVRWGLLNLFQHGSLGSMALIPQQNTDKAVKVPHLLRYTTTTLRHYQTLLTTLSQSREFQLTELPNQAWSEDVETTDVVYSQEHFGDVFTFPNQLTSPYLNPFAAAMSKPEGQPYQSIDLRRFRDESFGARIRPRTSLNGVWQLAYDHTIDYPSTVFDPQFLEGAFARARSNVGSGSIYEDMRRALLLQFILVPHPITVQFFLQNFFPPDFIGGFKSLGKMPFGATDNFEVYNIIFDPTVLIKKYEQEDGPHSSSESLFTKNESIIHVLKKTGLSHISIVGLGQLRIGKQTYSVYSQSEWPLITAQERKPSFTFQWKPALQSSLSDFQE